MFVTFSDNQEACKVIEGIYHLFSRFGSRDSLYTLSLSFQDDRCYSGASWSLFSLFFYSKLVHFEIWKVFPS